MRKHYALAIILVIALGITSRLIHTGHSLIDKYLGDALYATMLYLGFGILWPNQRHWKRAVLATISVTSIELFQLTGIPATLAQQPSTAAKLLATALGTRFSWLDLLAYLPGIAIPTFWQHLKSKKS